MGFGGLIIAGVPVSMVIVTLVEVAKRCGLKTQYAPVLAMVLGVAVTASVQLGSVFPFLRGWGEAIGAGVMLGLGASGLYSGSKAMIVRRGGRGGYVERVDGTVIETPATSGAIGPGKGGYRG